MTKHKASPIYYVALERNKDIIYIYQRSKPTINSYMMYNGNVWKITGYTATAI